MFFLSHLPMTNQISPLLVERFDNRTWLKINTIEVIREILVTRRVIQADGGGN